MTFGPRGWTDEQRHLTVTVTTNMAYKKDIEPGVAKRIWRQVVLAYDAEHAHSSPAGCS